MSIGMTESQIQNDEKYQALEAELLRRVMIWHRAEHRGNNAKHIQIRLNDVREAAADIQLHAMQLAYPCG